MRQFIVALAAASICVAPAYAGGWETVHRYVHRTGKCGAHREVLASYYWTGTRTANGERFNPHGMTAASREYAFGRMVSVSNPMTGRRCVVRINDRGPWGIAYRMGARLDLALGAARCLGMTQTAYLCVR
jgi:rare lipoprotein A (peptidoglycan hydrolase)